MLEPAIKTLTINFLQINIVPTSVTIPVTTNENLPAAQATSNWKAAVNPFSILVGGRLTAARG